jgi:endonuclease/exonuclease/phosphatase family metal-dependent hydrolase
MKLPAWLALLLLATPFHAPAADAKSIVIATYNVENYVAPDATDEPAAHRGKPKSEHAIEAVIRVIKDMHPDILGVCEMGSPERFEDFKKRLADAGMGYVDSEYVVGADSDRHLALVSRFPIVARQSQSNVPFELNGQPEKVRRGFLDVTIEVTPEFQLRMVGVHLKSRLPIPGGEAVVRRYEAAQLRKHLDSIFSDDPNAKLVCYGDFNDTKDQPMFHEITGIRGTPASLTDLPAKDEAGDKWTHYWKTADSYTRIDYLFVSRTLLRCVEPGSPRVYRSDYWSEASDHRPVFATIIPGGRK